VSGSEWVAVALAVVAAALAVAVVLVLGALTRTLTSLRAVVDDLNRETLSLITDLRGGAEKASADLERVEDLVVAAESVTRTVDGASRLAYMTFSNPVVKVLAFGSGLGRAGRRLRGKKRR